MTESRRDVVVIGAGPAGATAAFALARDGLDVLLADRSPFPRPKVCGCCLGPAALSALGRLGLGHVLDRAVPVRRFELATPRGRAVVAVSDWAVLSRERFDAGLAAEAVRAGAEFRDGCDVRVGAGDDTALSLSIGGEPVRASVVVAAAGLGSRFLPGSVRRDSRVGAGVTLCEAGEYEPGRIVMAVGPGGYVGVTRLEDGRLNLAAALDREFVRLHGRPGSAAVRILTGARCPVPRDLAERPWRGTPALTRSAVVPAGVRLFALGDAISYVEPFTGEGMARALESAGDVVPWVVRAREVWSQRWADEWTAHMERSRRRSQRLIRAVAWSVRRPVVAAAAVNVMRAVPVSAGRVIDRLFRATRTAPLPPPSPDRNPTPRTGRVPASSSTGPG